MKACLDCGGWIPADGPPRCPVHHAAHVATSARGARTRGDRWLKIRAAILDRDGHCCRVEGCERRVGLEVHHLVAVADGGSDEPDNLVTVCRPHHLELTPGRGDRRRRRSKRR